MKLNEGFNKEMNDNWPVITDALRKYYRGMLESLWVLFDFSFFLDDIFLPGCVRKRTIAHQLVNERRKNKGGKKVEKRWKQPFLFVCHVATFPTSRPVANKT